MARNGGTSERARHHRDEPQPADGRPGKPAAEFTDHLGD
jgi:hypothetical protein